MEPQEQIQTDPSAPSARVHPTPQPPATCGETTAAGHPCRVLVPTAGIRCGLHRMGVEERRQAAKLGSLVLTSRIRQGQVAVAQDAAQSAVDALQAPSTGAVVLLPDFSSPAAIALFLASVTEKIDRREIGPAQANAMTAAAAAALRALELQNEIQLLSREVAVVRDRLTPAPSGWRRVR